MVTDAIVPDLPYGYKRVHADLNAGSEGKSVFLIYKETENKSEAITGINVFAGEEPNFNIQRGWTKLEADINDGKGSKFIYICYTRQAGCPAVKSIQAVSGFSPHVYPRNPKMLRIGQNCNEGSGPDHIYLCYQLESLN